MANYPDLNVLNNFDTLDNFFDEDELDFLDDEDNEDFSTSEFGRYKRKRIKIKEKNWIDQYMDVPQMRDIVLSFPNKDITPMAPYRDNRTLEQIIVDLIQKNNKLEEQIKGLKSSVESQRNHIMVLYKEFKKFANAIELFE
jgi:hypothetical protein